MNRKLTIIKFTAIFGSIFGLLTAGAHAYEPVPFGMTLTSPFGLEWPDRGSIVAVYQARRLSDVAVFSIPWADAETGTENLCSDLAGAITFAQRLGMKIMMRHEQFVGGDVFIPASVGTTLADASVRLALSEELACFATLELDYFVVTNELNLIKIFNAGEYNILAGGFYSVMYNTVKERAPDTLVGVSYMYDIIQQSGHWAAYDNLTGPQDFVGITTYLGVESTDVRFPVPADIPADYFDQVRGYLGPDVRILFTEYAWAGNGENGFANQVDFLDRTPELLDGVRPEIVAWAALHDLTPSIQNPDHLSTTTAGLRELDGAEKPSWQKVISMHAEGSLQRYPDDSTLGD